MNGRGGYRNWTLAVLAALPLVAASTPARAQRWSPSREDAVLAEKSPVGSGLRRPSHVEGGVASSRPLATSRPGRLEPPASQFGRMHTFAQGQPIEELPAPRIVEGGPVYEPGYYDQHAQFPDAMGGDGFEDCCDDGCGDACCGNWNSCGPVPLCCLLPNPDLTNFELFAGVHGFTDPANRGGVSSFGFHEGFNYALPICCTACCGQIGMQWTQNNFSGSFITPEDRNQFFLTSGLFRRVDWGLQGGLVLDYLHDEWDYEFDVLALRGEIGWKCDSCCDIGFWFSRGTSDDAATARFATIGPQDEQIAFANARVTFEVNDLYAFYCRRQFACGGEGRLYGGFTGNSQGLFGGDVSVPLNPCWSLGANFLYVAAGDEQAELPDFVAETWNVSLSLVWRPCAGADCCPNYCQPLFGVANNGTLATTFK